MEEEVTAELFGVIGKAASVNELSAGSFDGALRGEGDGISIDQFPATMSENSAASFDNVVCAATEVSGHEVVKAVCLIVEVLGHDVNDKLGTILSCSTGKINSFVECSLASKKKSCSKNVKFKKLMEIGGGSFLKHKSKFENKSKRKGKCIVISKARDGINSCTMEASESVLILNQGSVEGVCYENYS